MNSYVATFHTHLAALRTFRTLSELGVFAQMTPVPRALSSSCGTCVMYEWDSPGEQYMDGDTQAIYQVKGSAYTLVVELS